MNLVTIKTEELEGMALDWAVSKAVCPPSFSQSVNPHSGLSFWSEGYFGGLTKDARLTAFELMTKLSISVNPWRGEDKCEPGAEWCSCGPDRIFIKEGRTHRTRIEALADNPATAILRTTVLLLLGNKVQVPADLLEVKNG